MFTEKEKNKTMFHSEEDVMKTRVLQSNLHDYRTKSVDKKDSKEKKAYLEYLGFLRGGIPSEDLEMIHYREKIRPEGDEKYMKHKRILDKFGSGGPRYDENMDEEEYIEKFRQYLEDFENDMDETERAQYQDADRNYDSFSIESNFLVPADFNSSNIWGVLYEVNSLRLEVQYIPDPRYPDVPRYYLYEQIPHDVFTSFSESISKGGWVWDNFRVRGSKAIRWPFSKQDFPFLDV